MTASACVICAARPHVFAEKGTALCYQCLSCELFNNRAYAKQRRKDERERENLDHPQVESETQGQLFGKE